MPDKFNELTSFLDSQLDKLHVLANKPQDVNFEDVTNQPEAYTWKDAHACMIEENEFRAFTEQRTDTPPRSKQQILDDMAFFDSLTPEEKQIFKDLEVEQKINEMTANKAEMLYKMNLTPQERVIYSELKREEQNAKYTKAVNAMKFF